MIYILNMSIFIWDYLNNFTSSLRKHQSLRLYRIPAIVMDGLIAFRTCTLASCSLLIFCVCSFVELCTLWYSPAKDKGVSHLHMTSRRFQYSPASRKETVRILIKLLLIVKHVFPLRVNQISSIGITKQNDAKLQLKGSTGCTAHVSARTDKHTHTHSRTHIKTHAQPAEGILIRP